MRQNYNSVLFSLIKYTLLLVVLFVYGNAEAQSKSGLSGYFQYSGAYLQMKNNSVASFLGNDISVSRNPSLLSEPMAQNRIATLTAFELKYTFKKEKYQLYFGGSLLDIIRLDLVQQLAIRRLNKNDGFISLGVLGTGLPVTVWKDQYAQEIDRKETYRNTYGIRFEWTKILDSKYSVQFDTRRVYLTEENGNSIGDLTDEEKELLNRNGYWARLRTSYTTKLSEFHTIVPTIVLRYNFLKGDAHKGMSAVADFAHIYRNNRINLVTNVFGGYRSYNKENPVYNKKQTNWDFGIIETFYFRLHNGKRNKFYLSGSLSMGDSKSNIEFFNEHSIMFQVGVMYRFGPFFNREKSL